jgi:hypothetical protein
MAYVEERAEIVNDHEIFNEQLTEIDTLKAITKIWDRRNDIVAVSAVLDTLRFVPNCCILIIAFSSVSFVH